MFLKLCGIVFQYNQCGRDQETEQSALFAVMWCQVACHMVMQ